MGIGYNPTSYSTCNLTNKNFLTIGCLNDNGTTFVFCGGLRQPCFIEVSIMVLDHLHNALYWKPIGMNIEERHEDTNHYATVMKIFIFLNFFYHYDFTVSTCYHIILRLARKYTDGTTEKIDNNAINDEAYRKRNLKRN